MANPSAAIANFHRCICHISKIKLGPRQPSSPISFQDVPWGTDSFAVALRSNRADLSLGTSLARDTLLRRTQRLPSSQE
jgi:hypothetical protein